jgi:nitrite reductase (NADH) large subunit
VGSARQVIIGNSAAGLSAARAIRRTDQGCRVTMITRENSLPYAPVILPYLLSGRVGRDDITIADPGFYQDHRIELLPGREAVDIDAKAQSVRLDDGSSVAYDNLLIATGASARKLGCDTGGVPKVMTLRTVVDAEGILEESHDAREIVAVGAGLVGLETANAFHKKGKKITVMAKSDQILSQNADTECARILQKELEKKGITFLFGRDVTALVRVDDRVDVVTDRNEKMAADLVIVGKGADPNIQFARNAGVLVEVGILVNDRMETSISNIYAAGDAAQAKDVVGGGYQTFGNWPSACLEGQVAGVNMAGGDRELLGEINYNMLPVFDKVVAFIGDTKPTSSDVETLTHSDTKRGTYRKIILRENSVIGAILLGAVQDAGIIRNLILKRANIGGVREDIVKHPLSWGRVLCTGLLG